MGNNITQFPRKKYWFLYLSHSLSLSRYHFPLGSFCFSQARFICYSVVSCLCLSLALFHATILLTAWLSCTTATTHQKMKLTLSLFSSFPCLAFPRHRLEDGFKKRWTPFPIESIKPFTLVFGTAVSLSTVNLAIRVRWCQDLFVRFPNYLRGNFLLFVVSVTRWWNKST